MAKNIAQAVVVITGASTGIGRAAAFQFAQQHATVVVTGRREHVLRTVLPASIDTPIFQHGANYTGRAVKPVEPVYSAEQVANAIVQLARHPQREVFVGNAGRYMAVLRTLAPAFAERIFARRVEKDHFQGRPAPPSEGNVFQPMGGYDAISGGWGASQNNGTFSGLAIAGAAALGVGLGFLLARGSRAQTGLSGLTMAGLRRARRRRLVSRR